MLPDQKLDALVDRHALLERELSSGLSAETYVKLSREFAELAPVVNAVKSYRAARRELDDLTGMIADPATDAEMRSIAEAEKPSLETKRAALEQQLRLALLPKDAMDERNVILEIRAGTGGDEASLFAGNLFRMYERYAALQGWKVEIVAASEGTMGGYKEIVAEIAGRGAFAKLKFESGVHRVQRVPDTEGSGRIHTSAATVAVLPEAEEVDAEINEADLKIDTMRAGGAGGQHVNKTESAVRITHIPSGIVVVMQDARSQHKNRYKAMAVLRTRLYDFERQKRDSARAAERRGQVGSGDRSERIRTYNYPQGRVTDHRINLTLHKLPQVMEGEALGEIIDALVAHHQAEQLAAETRVSAGRHCDAGRDSAHARTSMRRDGPWPRHSRPPVSIHRNSMRGCSSRMRSAAIRRRCWPTVGGCSTTPKRAPSPHWRSVASRMSLSRALSAPRNSGVSTFVSMRRRWCRGRRRKRWWKRRWRLSIVTARAHGRCASPTSAPGQAPFCSRC